MPTPHPAHPREISPAWLGESLGLPVLAVEVQVLAEDRGFTGVVAVVAYRCADGRSGTLVAKFPMAVRDTESLVRRQASVDATAVQRHFERSQHEIWVYQTLLPGTGVAAPALLSGIVDQESRTIILLLEHIGDARAGDVLAGSGVADAKSVIREIAKLHGHWWRQAPPTTSRPSRQRLDSFREIEQRYGATLDPFLDIYGPRLPAELTTWMRTVGPTLPGVVEALRHAPRTMIHADLHLDNILFPYLGDAPVVLDWQSAAAGPGVLDLALFLGNALSPRDFTAHLDDILVMWLERVDPGGSYGLEQARQDFGRAMTLLWCGGLRWQVNAARANIQGRERAMVDELLDNGRFIHALMTVTGPRS